MFCKHRDEEEIKISQEQSGIGSKLFIFALITLRLTEKRGLEYTTNLGFIILIIGVIFFNFACYIKISFILFLAIVVLIAGENLVIGFAVRAISCVSKEYQGIASSFIVMAAVFL